MPAHKLHYRTEFQGLQISIENRKGSYRYWKDDQGNEGKTYMHCPYGYIRLTEGTDGDHVDCYIGPNKESRKVYVVHQNVPETGKYDEDKVMLGFDSAAAAKKAYLRQYDDPKFFGSMTTMTIDTFADKVKHKKGKIIKSRLRLTVGSSLINLEKGRALPDGTRRKYGSNWFVKMGGQWVYDGRVNQQRSGSGVGKKSQVRKKIQQQQQPQQPGLEPISQAEFDSAKQRFTTRSRIGEGQDVQYTGTYHRGLTGQRGKLVAIGKRGFAMVQYPNGVVESASWKDIKPVGKIQPHSLYDKVDPKNVFKASGDVKKKLDETMRQKIGSSNMNYYDLCRRFQKEGFNLQVVGGTVRDILRGEKDVKDVDFIFNGTDNELRYVVNKINPSWLRNAVTNSHLGLCSFTDGSDVVDITPVHKYSKEMGGMAKGWNLDDDARSRDLAMNSLQVDPLTGIVCDPTGNGVKDIQDNTINFCDASVLKAAPRYVLRAFKFIARGYKTTPATDAAIRQNLKYTNQISPGRRASFIKRQIGEKDGLKGLDAFKAAFRKYNANLWDREFDSIWRNVYRQFGGRP